MYAFFFTNTVNVFSSEAIQFIVLYCIVLYCIVLYCIVLYCIVLYCIVLYNTCMQFLIQFAELEMIRCMRLCTAPSLVCPVCNAADRSMVFLPCGHLACCTNCATSCTTCPSCGGDVRGSVQAYLS